jgi:hypothetical protein
MSGRGVPTRESTAASKTREPHTHQIHRKLAASDAFWIHPPDSLISLMKNFRGAELIFIGPTCYYQPMPNRTEPKTPRQRLRYIVVAIIALGLVTWMLRLYVL